MNYKTKYLILVLILSIDLVLLKACFKDIPPLLAHIENSPLSYVEDERATEITTTLTIIDNDSKKLSGATVQITGNYQNTEDQLAYNKHLPTTITVDDFDIHTGTLTLSGSALVSDYQTALRAITYRNTNTMTPDTSTRTITFTVSDWSNKSNLVTRDINVILSNDAPILDKTKNQLGKVSDLKLNTVLEDVGVPNGE